MKITLKTLQQKAFDIDIEPESTIADLKAKVEESQGFPVAHQKLIHAGKVLVDTDTVASCNIKEKQFLVVMVTKPKAAPVEKPVEKPVESKPEPKEPVASSSTEASSSAAAAAPPADAGSALLTGGALNEAITNLMAMGFERDQVMKAMRASFNNPDRAAEYLFSGIPEHLTREMEASSRPAPAPAAQTASSSSSAPAASSAVNLFEAAAAAANQPASASSGAATTGAGGLEFLRNSPQFQQLRQLVQSNPQMLQPILQQLAQSNPELMQRINESPDDFLQLLGDDGEDEGGAAPGGGRYITISPADADAIARLEGLGFDRDLVIEAYFACDKNEELAANYLFDMVQDQ